MQSLRYILGWAVSIGWISASVNAIDYSVYDDATWAVLSSKVSLPNRRTEYQSFMAACRSSAGKNAYHLCDRDEAHRMQMNMYQPRSVRDCESTAVLGRTLKGTHCSDRFILFLYCRYETIPPLVFKKSKLPTPSTGWSRSFGTIIRMLPSTNGRMPRPTIIFGRRQPA